MCNMVLAHTGGCCSLQHFAVDELLSKYDKTAVNGAELVSSLKAGKYYDSKERNFFIKVIGRHLMKNCNV